MTTELVLTNARVVLQDEVITGTVRVRDGRITDISDRPTETGEDLDGDYLVPGLVELHTDHLEIHYAPRPGVRWDMKAAIQAHDAQIAASGITTVFDCLRMGSDEDEGFKHGEMRELADAIEASQAEGRLRSDHRIHLRCEVSSSNVLEDFAAFHGDARVGLVSMMDHAPGQRQFQDIAQYTKYYKAKRKMNDEQFARFIEERQAQSAEYADPHRKAIAARCKERGITVASHDDATIAHVDEAVGFGVRLAEFPTSFEAAKASHGAGMSVLMGAPNIVRGGSHSGNIAARELAEVGVLDVLSSDYVPISLIHAPFVLADTVDAVSLPEAVAMVTATPARTVGLDDRGRIAAGLRADLVRVRRADGDVPVVRSVWSGGVRVA